MDSVGSSILFFLFLFHSACFPKFILLLQIPIPFFMLLNHMASKHPRTVKEIFQDFRARRTALVRALTQDVDKLYELCDPEKENLCLYGHPDETWEVTLPSKEAPAVLPEPVLGINFSREGVNRKDWLYLVAVHSDSWLHSVAFYLGARLNHTQRSRLFNLINDLPAIWEVVTGRKPIEDKPTKVADKVKDEHKKIFCGVCRGNYNEDEFWIGCDKCEWWYHGKCVMVTPANPETLNGYKCPSCTLKKARPCVE